MVTLAHFSRSKDGTEFATVTMTCAARLSALLSNPPHKHGETHLSAIDDINTIRHGMQNNLSLVAILNRHIANLRGKHL